jgi:hypothetical protein
VGIAVFQAELVDVLRVKRGIELKNNATWKKEDCRARCQNPRCFFRGPIRVSPVGAVRTDQIIQLFFVSAQGGVRSKSPDHENDFKVVTWEGNNFTGFIRNLEDFVHPPGGLRVYADGSSRKNFRKGHQARRKKGIRGVYPGTSADYKQERVIINSDPKVLGSNWVAVKKRNKASSIPHLVRVPGFTKDMEKAVRRRVDHISKGTFMAQRNHHRPRRAIKRVRGLRIT